MDRRFVSDVGNRILRCSRCPAPLRWSQAVLRAAYRDRKLYRHQCQNCGWYDQFTTYVSTPRASRRFLSDKEADLYAINSVMFITDQCKVCHRLFDVHDMEVVERGTLIWKVNHVCPDCHTLFEEVAFSPIVEMTPRNFSSIENDAAL